MFDSIVESALRYRIVVLGALAAVALLGALAFHRLPIEAYPDVADVSVQIITQWQGHAAEEVEREISVPIEIEMNGVPKKTHIRSTSIFGLNVVTLIFEDGTDVFFARQQVAERLAKAEVPPGVKPSLGPLASPIGEILRYTLQGPQKPLEELKQIEDFTVERALRSVPGVADVISFGGPTKQYQVFVKPERLAAYGIDVGDVASALSRSNRNAGGGAIEVGPQSINVRGQGLIASPDEIRDIAIRTDEKGTPVHIRDVAEVDIGHAARLGVVGIGQDDDVVQATVLMRRGENAADVLDLVRKKVAELNAPGALPAGVQIVPYYDRARLIDATTHTVLTNMVEGILLVAFILFLFLGNLRTATIVALSIPMALLVAFIGMDAIGLPANLLSIGAVDFGMVVEGTVITVEHVFTQLAAAGAAGATDTGASRIARIQTAAKEVARPMAFSVAIITMAYLPIFTLERVEGKLFRPMAFTVAFALIGSLVFALTAAPALASYLLRGKLKEFESPLLKWRKTLYPKALRWAISHRVLVLGAALSLAGGAVALTGRVGSEFLPHLDEGAIWARATMPPNISLPESRALVSQMRRIFVSFPEVETVTSQAGRPDDGTDPTGFYNGEFYVALKPREKWRSEFHGNKDKVIEAMASALEQFPGIAFGFSQPIADNVEEATSGVKGQLAVKIYGADLEVLERLASEVGREVERVRGVSDFAVLRQLGQTNLAIAIDRGRAGQAGVDVEDVQDAIEAGVGGRVVTQIIEGERRVDLVVRMSETARGDIEALRRLGVGTHQRRIVPIGQVADLKYVTGASRIVREDNSRYVAIKFGVRDRDLGSVVSDAQANVTKAVKLPEGYRMVWSGEFESQRRANARLAMILPITLGCLTVLLIGALRSGRDALILLGNVLLTSPPGGILALYLARTNFSVSAGVGFLALFGVSVQAGILLVDRIARLRRDGAGVDEAVISASVSTARPIALTGLVATFGLLPAALSHGIGSDAQRPLAIVVVGGLAGSLFLSLIVLPTLYRAVVAFWPDKVVDSTMPPPGMPPGEPSESVRPERESAGRPAIVVGAVAVLAVLLLPARASAQQAPAPAPAPAAESGATLTVEHALSLFRDQNLELLAARHDLAAARAQVIAAGLLQNPTLSAGAVVMVHGTPTGGEQQLTVQIEQVIPIGGQPARRREVASLLASAAERDFAAVFFKLAFDVHDAYLAVQIAEARRAIVRQGLADLDRVEAIVASRVAAGANAQYDRMRVDVERSKWRSRLADADADVLDAHTRLARAIGGAPGSLGSAPVAPLGEPPALETAPPDAVATALAQRPEVLAEQRRAEAMSARVAQVRREFVPSPSVSVGYTPWFNVPTAAGYKGGGAVMAGVSIPLPVWDHGQGTIDRAQAEALAAHARRDATGRAIATEVDQAVRTLAIRLSAWRQHHDEAVSSATRMRQMADAAYREGKLGILELVDAYDSLLTASETALDLRASAWSAARAVERALGPVAR